MEMAKTPLDLTCGQIVSSGEILDEITPIEWSEDVLNGNHKDEAIVKSKVEEIEK